MITDLMVTDLTRMLEDNIRIQGKVVIVKTFLGRRSEQSFTNADEAMNWVKTSLFDTLANEAPVDVAISVNVFSTLHLVVKKTRTRVLFPSLDYDPHD